MGVELFKEITTDEYLVELQKNADRYDGLYVDMNNAEERKYVKGKALLITDLVKKIDRARIYKSRDFKNNVEAEAKRITEKLESANKPFTLLIDEHSLERKRVLAKEKEIADAKALVIQIKEDHANAITLNKIFDFEKEEIARKQRERDEQIRTDAALAVTQEAERLARAEGDRVNEEARQKVLTAEREKQAVIDLAEKQEKDRLQIIANEQAEQLRRENDKAHKGKINRQAVEDFRLNGFDEEEAKAIITAIAQGLISNVTINY